VQDSCLDHLLSGFFQLRKLGAFLSAFPTGFAAERKSLDVGMLFASFGKLFAGACADVA